ncbi:helix-turn-helix domain-containing protein [Butyrivibrio sp. MC2013]|uniref:helix-turn-helix domain-containing protein n=1 Tax=Butyrivibrio sp. MC2013 TaxID=1280686 RepID=UPI000417778B|nr:helix-turn-helix transcriptional regulator [Butyrivibrio sp. MC2013]
MMQLRLDENIRKYRKSIGLTQEELAEAFGVTVGAVSKWESGSTVPDILTMMEMADFFDISLDVLVGYSLSSESIDSFTDRLDTLLNQRKYEEAIVEAEKMLVRHPSNLRILMICAQNYSVISIITGRENYDQKAIELYEKALKYTSQDDNPDITQFKIKYQIAELRSRNDHSKAIKEFARINYMGITDLNIGRQYAHLGETDEALHYYTKVLFSILVCSIEYAMNMMSPLVSSGKKGGIREAVDIIDWAMTLFDNTCGEGISYMTKVKVILLTMKAMCLCLAGDTVEMKACIDKAYSLALEYDRNPSYDFTDKIRFWHAHEDFHPSIYDELGMGAVESIDNLFSQGSEPIPHRIMKKTHSAKEYWDSIKK